MLKKTVTYTDYDGIETSETLYFNISKPEFLSSFTANGGIVDKLRRMTDPNDYAGAVDAVSEFILASYGEKSADGKRFVKSEKSREEFSQSEAFVTVFDDLMADPEALIAFVRGVMPADYQKLFDESVSVVAKGAPALPVVE